MRNGLLEYLGEHIWRRLHLDRGLVGKEQALQQGRSLHAGVVCFCPNYAQCLCLAMLIRDMRANAIDVVRLFTFFRGVLSRSEICRLFSLKASKFPPQPKRWNLIELRTLSYDGHGLH